MPDEINLSEYKEPLTTAARGIASASWLMEKAKSKGKDAEVKRLMAQIDRLELAVAKYLESRNEGTK
jgi:hypothetical protein